ncbi:uncharacterized protein A4U43_C01F11970 [Asparagus officinalis]|uniref:Uncharacterized protein n=1 Tax=Asparagus officinalis TaxID=4686 RepID=A0A5P1FP87_ASPOF|nr:uncharacterized protein A4U43_C01F11970 [Asparagus officinalis]
MMKIKRRITSSTKSLTSSSSQCKNHSSFPLPLNFTSNGFIHHLNKLLHDFFDAAFQAIEACVSLLSAIDHVRSHHRSIHRLLPSLPHIDPSPHFLSLQDPSNFEASKLYQESSGVIIVALVSATLVAAAIIASHGLAAVVAAPIAHSSPPLPAQALQVGVSSIGYALVFQGENYDF